MPKQEKSNNMKRMISKKSFTLIELILVIVVLSIGFGSLLLALKFAAINSAQAQFNTVSNFLCQEMLETGLTFRDERDAADGFAALPITTINETPVTGFTQYNRSTVITYVDIGDLSQTVAGPTDYKKITVTVTGPSSSVPVTISTVVSDY